MRSPKMTFKPSAQKGTALIVSLIILSLVTILGISSMQGSGSELKMAGSLRDRGVAFEAAEAAIAIIEGQLAVDPPSRLELLSTCAGANCYNATCAGGLCFDGDYLLSYSEFECQVAKYASTTKARVNFWSDPTLNVWKNSAKHKVMTIDSVKTDVKYITEFLCYVARDTVTPFTALVNENNNGAPLFRITVLAEGNGGRASVALQSTYKVLNGQ
jgi:type IV pilus assembly protein PilX